MRISFPVPSTRTPVGGVAISYEFAEALADRGHHVTVLHHELFGNDAVASLAEISWYDFRDNVDHVFMTDSPPDYTKIPSADIFVGHHTLIDETPRLGLPVKMIQGWDMYPKDLEIAAYEARCPKACVALWLRRIGTELGIDQGELIHTPLGLDHERFRITQPIADRRPRVTFCFNPHPQKGAQLALDTLARLHDRHPNIRLTAFGTSQPDVPEWLEYVHNPSPAALTELYNTTSIFLCSSVVEGFGLTNLEALACGTTLVTTANGGCEDYAINRETALVAEDHTVESLLALIDELLVDNTTRQTLGSAGAAKAATFSWPRSAEIMEEFFTGYLNDPVAYGRSRS